MLTTMTEQSPRTRRPASQSRLWTVTVAMLVLAINFAIEAVQDLPASSTPALWVHLAAAIGCAYAFIHCLRTAVRSYQQRQDRPR